MITKQEFLAQAGGNTPQQIYDASKTLNYSADQVDSIMGYSAGTSASWLDNSGGLLSAPKTTATLDAPPTATATQPTSTTIQPASVTGTKENRMTGIDAKTGLPNYAVYAAPDSTAKISQAQQGIRDFVSSGITGPDGNITDQDAYKIYSMAMSGELSKDELSSAIGVPMELIDNWLAKSGLTFPEQKKGASMFSLDSSPVIKAITQEVQPNQTAAHQLAQLLASNSPYIRQVDKDSARDANALNLMNSSAAVGQGRAAAIRAGLPVALNDANTYAQQAITNQNALNAAETDNAQIRLSRMNTMDQVTQSERESVRSNETSRLNQLAENEVRVALAQMSDQTQLTLEQVRAENNINLNDLNARSGAFNNMIVAVGNIEGNQELNAQQKSEAINRTVSYYNSYLSYLDKLGVREAAAA
jgi:hypothetical protein